MRIEKRCSRVLEEDDEALISCPMDVRILFPFFHDRRARTLVLITCRVGTDKNW